MKSLTAPSLAIPSPTTKPMSSAAPTAGPSGHPRGCCAEKGGEALRDHMKSRAKDLGLRNVRINNAACLDRCELGPTMVIYPEGVWYSCPTKEDIDEVLETHLLKGGRVERLMLRTEDKLPADRAKRVRRALESENRNLGAHGDVVLHWQRDRET